MHKFQEKVDWLHSLPRTEAYKIIADSDITSRQRDILINHELDRNTTIKELAEKYCVEERCIERCKQKAFEKLKKNQ